MENENIIKSKHNKYGKVYKSQYPSGTPIEVKSKRVLELIQNVWSKKPIPLNILNPDGSVARRIEVRFDPTYDPDTPTDAGKLMSKPKYVSRSTGRVALDIADHWYEIIERSRYHSSAPESGKILKTHDGVKEWHYFINDILFQDADGGEPRPYRILIDVKERDDGNFVYNIIAQKTKETVTLAANPSASAPPQKASPSPYAGFSPTGTKGDPLL